MSCLQEIIQFSPNLHQIKSYYVSRRNIFIRGCLEIYRHLLSKCFKNAIIGRQERVQCKYFFWHQTETCLLENLQSQKDFWLLREDIIFNVKWVEVCKIVERNCIVKCVIFFANFCWLWDFLLENLKLRKKALVLSIGTSGDVNWNVWRNIKMLYAGSSIFEKKNSNYEILNHLYFGPVFIFGEFALGRFSQYFLKFFLRRPTIMADIFAQLPLHPHPP